MGEKSFNPIIPEEEKSKLQAFRDSLPTLSSAKMERARNEAPTLAYHRLEELISEQQLLMDANYKYDPETNDYIDDGSTAFRKDHDELRTLDNHSIELADTGTLADKEQLKKYAEEALEPSGYVTDEVAKTIADPEKSLSAARAFCIQKHHRLKQLIREIEKEIQSSTGDNSENKIKLQKLKQERETLAKNKEEMRENGKLQDIKAQRRYASQWILRDEIREKPWMLYAILTDVDDIPI